MIGLPDLFVKRLQPEAELPVYESAGAGAFDVKSLDTVAIPPGEYRKLHTGLAFEVPENFLMIINVRSGMGAKHGLRIRNTVGYIDSDYRGELFVVLENGGSQTYQVTAGDRVAQCAVVMAPQFKLREVKELSSTARGADGYGSTGK